jgi:hypothetical protein
MLFDDQVLAVSRGRHHPQVRREIDATPARQSVAVAMESYLPD